eukprot:12881-Heterococcus_DN1.PRE.3
MAVVAAIECLQYMALRECTYPRVPTVVSVVLLKHTGSCTAVADVTFRHICQYKHEAYSMLLQHLKCVLTNVQGRGSPRPTMILSTR